MIRVATYNIHKCIGIDRRRSIERIARVLDEIDADAVALQEVVIEHPRGSWRGSRIEPARRLIETAISEAGRTLFGSGTPAGRGQAGEGGLERSVTEMIHDQASQLARLTGLTVVVGPAIDEPGHVYGNVVLTRLPVEGYENFDISTRRREPRACLRVDLGLPGNRVLHLFNTHFGTSHPERIEQSRRLLDSGILHASHPENPQVLVGDFNDWFAGEPSRVLGDRFHEATRRLSRTYPAVAPVMRLDRIYVNHHVRVRRVERHASRLARIASDHAPIVAVLDVLATQPASGSE